MSSTKQRELIKRIVQTSCGHPSADEIFEKAKDVMPGIVLATVYNNLNALYKNGEIGKVYKTSKANLFDKSTVPHAHIICEKCGNTDDLLIDGIDDIIKEKLKNRFIGYELNVYFICDNCKKKIKP